MNHIFNDTLPCLQTVGPWWTEDDRRLLFCHLTKMFDFEDGYLSSLPAAEYFCEGEYKRLSNADIQNEYLKFLKVNSEKTYTCSKIKNLKFSFGKINRRICMLCPFCDSYKNYHQIEEFRFIYYFLKNEHLNLNSFLALNKVNVEEVFGSYFPVYIEDVLVDALPFAMIVNHLASCDTGFHKSTIDVISEELSQSCYDTISQITRYVRQKNMYEVNGIKYRDEIYKSPSFAFNKLIEINTKTRTSVNEPMLIRLINRLKDNNTFIPHSKSEYHRLLNSSKDNRLFQTTITSIIDDSSVSVPKQSLDIICSDITKFEDPNFNNNPELDTSIICSIDANADTSPVTALPLCIVANNDSISADSIDECKNKLTPYSDSEFAIYKNFYALVSSDNIYIYGQDSNVNSSNIFKAFFEDSRYLSMESADYDDNKGILIMNSDGDLMFYSIEHYGPKPLRKIADTNIPVYTSNIYYLCRYLYKNRVYNFNLKDVGTAFSLSSKNIAKGINDISSKMFPGCMKQYKDIYENSVQSLICDERHQLERLEKYYSLICSDGDNPPFDEICELFSFSDSLTLNYIYKKNCLPVISGTYVHLKCCNSKNTDRSLIYRKFMDCCIDVNKHYPFTNGTINILRLTENEMLFYLTGSSLDIQKAQLYLSSSIRRIFASVAFKSDHIQITEKTLLYDHKLKKVVND